MVPLLSDFFEFCRLTGALAEIVKFGSSDFAVADDLEVVDFRRVDGESSFDADAVGYATNGNGFADSAVFECDDDAFVRLKSLFVAFFDFDEDFDFVTDSEFGKICFHTFFFESVDNVAHVDLPPIIQSVHNEYLSQAERPSHACYIII